MQLEFFKYAATSERIDKSAYLKRVGTIDNVLIKESTDLMTPVFILKNQSLIYNSNYVYCSYTSRYYYIESYTAMPGDLIAINCKIDVLYTYKTDILNSPAWIVKTDTKPADSDYNDGDLMHQDYPFTQEYETRCQYFSTTPLLNTSSSEFGESYCCSVLFI